MDPQTISIKKNVISPFQCISEAFEHLKNGYWTLVGIAAVGIIVGSLVPMAILMGPMMCGIYLCYLAKIRNQPFVFADLFNKGFTHFLESLIAMLIQMGIVLVPTIIMVAVFIFGIVLFEKTGQGNNHNPAMIFMIVGLYASLVLFIIIATIPFMFSYPLIADKQLKAWPAIKLSFEAVKSNLLGICLLVFSLAFITFLGMLCCYVGMFFVLPLTFMAHMVAYEKIFNYSGSSII